MQGPFLASFRHSTDLILPLQSSVTGLVDLKTSGLIAKKPRPHKAQTFVVSRKFQVTSLSAYLFHVQNLHGHVATRRIKGYFFALAVAQQSLRNRGIVGNLTGHRVGFSGPHDSVFFRFLVG